MAKAKNKSALSGREIINDRGASMSKIVSLCKRRGFVFPSSEIYGGLTSSWDYGPLGTALKNRIQSVWWEEMTRHHRSIVGLDAAIMMHPRAWEASGHVTNFADRFVDCKTCRSRFREDQIPPEALSERECPECSGELTPPRQFNLMFQTHLGPVADDGSLVYLRPETAQGIYVNFKNVLNSSRLTVPFGIAQVGKAFRNEITTKNFIFRTCEFEQMEMQFFVKPGEEEKWFSYWKEKRMAFYRNKLGLIPEDLRFHAHGPDELAHYAKEASDIEYRYPFGWRELEGIHSRTDFDLRSHQDFSGKDAGYLDPQTGENYIPYIVETSAGLTRTFLVALMDAYEEEVLTAPNTTKEETRTVLHLHPQIAPITVGICPLVKKDGLAKLAQEIEEEVRERHTTFYDHSGAIGRRYRRLDEIGTPFVLTIDYQSLKDQTITLRFRDSMKQVRISRKTIGEILDEEIKNYSRPPREGEQLP